MFIKNISYPKSDNKNKLLSSKEYQALAYKLIFKSRYFQKSFLKDEDLMSNIVTEIMIADNTFDSKKGPSLNAYRISRINFEIQKFLEFQTKPKIYSEPKPSYESEELEECLSKLEANRRNKLIMKDYLFTNMNYSHIGERFKLSGTHIKNIVTNMAKQIYDKYYS